MEFVGTIERIVFRNSDNGYSVVTLSVDGRLETAVGVFPSVSEGEEVVINGKKIINTKFGEQIKVESIITKPPSTPDSIVRYLSSDLFKGVGEVTAQRIVEKFGTYTFEIIKDKPLELAKVKGVTLVKAYQIQEKYEELQVMQRTIMFLQDYDITLNLAMKIYECYGAATEQIIRTNPYRMVHDISRVGFATADKIAIRMGLDIDNPARVSAGICHILETQANQKGNTFHFRERVLNMCLTLLSYDEMGVSLINVGLDDMISTGRLIRFKVDNEEAIMLKHLYDLEHSIADRLCQIDAEYDNIYDSLSADISDFEKLNSITFHQSQKDAIKSAVLNGVSVITGGPGTGKTTIIKCIIEIISARSQKIALCAPTGRASKRLFQATGNNASTIHRLLGLDFMDGQRKFKFDAENVLDYNTIIVDEVSMVDEYIFSALISAIRNGASLILVGDKDQLPSVGVGNILSDIIASGRFQVLELTEIFRQGNESNIISNAHRINNGLMPILENTPNTDFFFIESESAQKTVDIILSLVTDRLPKFLNVEKGGADIQVLCPMKKGFVGVDNLNTSIQDSINPGGASIFNIKNVYREGDKVIHLKNNYLLEWTKSDGDSGSGIFNGDIGIVHSVNMIDKTITVLYDDEKYVNYNSESMSEISLAYAITIHKSQGSEFDAVIIVMSSANRIMLNRNLFYTAVTRAKKLVILVGDVSSIGYSVKNNSIERRLTMLKEYLNGQNA